MHDWITNLVRPNQLIHPFILSPSIHQFNLSLSIHQFTRSPSIRQFILSPTIHQFNLSPSIHQIILSLSIHRYKCANSLSAVHRCPFIQFYVQLYVRVHTVIQIYLYIQYILYTFIYHMHYKKCNPVHYVCLPLIGCIFSEHSSMCLCPPSHPIQFSSINLKMSSIHLAVLVLSHSTIWSSMFFFIVCTTFPSIQSFITFTT